MDKKAQREETEKKPLEKRAKAGQKQVLAKQVSLCWQAERINVNIDRCR